MSDLTWHLDQANIYLEDWYEQAEKFFRQREFFLNLVIPAEGAADDVQRKALHCKTAGLVWHDRFKMLLDCRRNNF